MDLTKTETSAELLKLSEHKQNQIPTPDQFVLHFPQFLSLYISGGNPTADTMKTYTSNIGQFIEWCIKKGCHPLYMTDLNIRIYIRELTDKGYKQTTVALKTIAVKAFFSTAYKMGVIEKNPARDIPAKSAYSTDNKINFFSVEQISTICDVFDAEEDPFTRCRNTLIIYLMSVEGLRNVEVHRLDMEDIDWQNGIITIKGKGRNRLIYPCKDTLKVLDQYLSTIESTGLNSGALILSKSNNNNLRRISRNGIRYIVDRALISCNLKFPHVSCHIFRHSCGTNLYQQVKDLRYVQEVLGHRDPKTTARYAHLTERLGNRRTESIVPKRGDKHDD